MAKRKKTGGRDIQPGEVLNPGGNSRKGTIIRANDFKEWAFDFWLTHKTDFEDVILSDQKTMMNFMRMLALFVPQKIEGPGDTGEFVVVVK